MIYLILVFVVIILFISIGYWVYVFLKPHLISSEGRMTVLKGFLVLTGLSAAGYILVFFSMKEPAYFEKGIEQLHKSKYIDDHVGDFNSYTYNPNKLLKEPLSPATFQV